MTGTLEGKVALVTGASRGIGRAIAERLGRDGARVVVTDLAVNDEGAGEAVAAIRRAGTEAAAVPADLSKVEEIRRLYREVEKRFGGLDIVVNNAAVWTFKPIVELTEEDYDLVFGLVSRGTFFSMQEAARLIRDGGRIVNISSTGVVATPPGTALYVGAKASVEHFTKVLARELGPRGVTVNALRLGTIDTEAYRQNISPEIQEQAAGASPLGRIGQPEDVADFVGFLAGDDARWITGQWFHADGGSV